MRCKYCGAKLKRDAVGLYCPTPNCDWSQGAEDDSEKAGCEWHGSDDPIDVDDTPGCPNCGRLLNTKTCDACGDEFLDFEWAHADDVVGSPCGDSNGDLCCSGCIRQVEARIRATEAEGGE